MCNNGKNIHVGNQFLANYNVTILNIMSVNIGDYVMIGPNTLITTVNHPMTAKGCREHLGIGKPITIGNDVWIGGNVTILPSVTIGNNVVIAADAVVTKDVHDNTLIGGVPAKIIRYIVNTKIFQIKHNLKNILKQGSSSASLNPFMESFEQALILKTSIQFIIKYKNQHIINQKYF